MRINQTHHTLVSLKIKNSRINNNKPRVIIKTSEIDGEEERVSPHWPNSGSCQIREHIMYYSVVKTTNIDTEYKPDMF